MKYPNAFAIFRAALAAADPAQAVLDQVQVAGGVLTTAKKRYSITSFDRIRVIGAGKASAQMAKAVERLFGPRIFDGWVNIPEGSGVSLRRIHLHEAGHPIPDRSGAFGARRIAEIARESGSRDLLICLISGGASALMPLPASGITLAQKKSVTRKLLASGATIHEINTVRKHLSAIKGGHLAALAYPATLITLVLSDVIGDDLDVIGSGPSVADRSTCADASRILREYGIASLPLSETPKPGSPEFKRVENIIIGSNRRSIAAASEKAGKLGYRTIVLSTTIDGETRDVARMHAAIVREMIAHGGKRVCFLSGGETTVTVRGKGLGGRNQEFVLAAIEALRGTPGVTVFSAGTDGIDGPTDAAGAVWNTSTKMTLDPRGYLANNDSYHFFSRAGGLVKTGPTGTNVMDVRILLVE